MTARDNRPPTPGAPRPYRFPSTERRSLSSGAAVVVAPVTKAPLVTLTAIFHRAGATHDPANREGLAQLTASAMLEGSTHNDGAALADQFESLGSSLSASADWDATTVSFSVHRSRLDAAIVALRDVFRGPAFPARHVTRLREEHRAERLQVTAESRDLADAALVWSCYGDRSRYRRPISGTIATVDAISRDDIAAFWNAQYDQRALTVVLAGDISVDSGAAAAEMLLDGWTNGPFGEVEMSGEPRYSGGQVTLIEKPGAAQAELRLGHVGVPRVHPSYFSLTVMNAVLGGLFSSRINLNLRERHGYTYGASSGFDWRRSAGPWVVSTAVKTEACGDALREVLVEIGRIRTDDIARDELELAADYLVGVFPLRFETTSAVASALASQALFGLPADYFDRYRDDIAAVTPTDVRKAAVEHVHPDRLQIAVVGDPAILSAMLSPLAAAGLHVRSPEQVESAL